MDETAGAPGDETKPYFVSAGEGPTARRIAVCAGRPVAPPSPGAAGLLWLPGFRSDMKSTKALALAEWARQNHVACTRFDYSGHGLSEGRFEDGTMGSWLEDALAVFQQATQGPQILVGSSMGGYIALLLLRRLQAEPAAGVDRIRALVLIAPAWDMTEALLWAGMSAEERHLLVTQGAVLYPSPPYDAIPITRQLIEEGRNHLLAGKRWAPGCPVHVLQGLRDAEVPPAHTRKLAEILEGPVHFTEIPDGDHRLSRPEDLALLFKTIGQFVPPR